MSTAQLLRFSGYGTSQHRDEQTQVSFKAVLLLLEESVGVSSCTLSDGSRDLRVQSIGMSEGLPN